MDISLPGPQRQRMCIVFGVLDCRVRRHFPELRGAPTRSRVLLPEHIAILQSAASSGPRSARRAESRPASRCRFPRCENGSVFLRVPIENQTLIPLIANPCAQEECIRRAKAGRFSQVAELTDLSEMASRKRAFFRSRCPCGTAGFAAACPFHGTQEQGWARERTSRNRAECKVHCRSVTQKCVRFRVSEFSVAAWSASFEDMLPPLSVPPQPSCIALVL